METVIIKDCERVYDRSGNTFLVIFLKFSFGIHKRNRICCLVFCVVTSLSEHYPGHVDSFCVCKYLPILNVYANMASLTLYISEWSYSFLVKMLRVVNPRNRIKCSISLKSLTEGWTWVWMQHLSKQGTNIIRCQTIEKSTLAFLICVVS